MKNRIQLILDVMERHCDVDCAYTMNQIIDVIYSEDVVNGRIRNGWRFYVHLNKLISGMAKESLVEHTGYEVVNGRKEKLWNITDAGLAVVKRIA